MHPMSQHGGEGASARLLLIAGPTASGKSALASALAGRLHGTVINADAMQVYAELHVLTARPSAAETARAPHRLYGVRSAAMAGSVAWWRAAAIDAIASARAAGRLPIVCGGTGLYLAALLGGLSPVPAIDPERRAAARALLDRLGAAGLHARLAAVDPVTAGRLRPGDGQRVARAWEVWQATGRGLSAWQERPPAPLEERTADVVLLDPPRGALREGIARRAAGMVEGGAVAEVEALRRMGLDPALPAMRAIGVREITALLDGTADRATAIARITLATGQYAKRQTTWFRRGFPTGRTKTHTIHASPAELAQYLESFTREIELFLRSPVDLASAGP